LPHGSKDTYTNHAAGTVPTTGGAVGYHHAMSFAWWNLNISIALASLTHLVLHVQYVGTVASLDTFTKHTYTHKTAEALATAIKYQALGMWVSKTYTWVFFQFSLNMKYSLVFFVPIIDIAFAHSVRMTFWAYCH
jgi:hypothetical protein